MDIHNIVAVIVGIITIFSAIYKLGIEPTINAKIAALETKSFLTIDNLKERLNDKITALDRKVDIHLQDYINYKDAILLQSRGLDEKINHTWSKTEKLLNEQKAEIKDIRAFQQKLHDTKE